MSVGVGLSLPQMLHLIHTNTDFAVRLCRLSNYSSDSASIAVGGRGRTTSDTTWPMMCISIGFTKEAITAFRTGALNKLCNQKKSVLAVLHELHMAMFVDFYRCGSLGRITMRAVGDWLELDNLGGCALIVCCLTSCLSLLLGD